MDEMIKINKEYRGVKYIEEAQSPEIGERKICKKLGSLMKIKLLE